jgi:short-subunit dehydrogenase
VCSSDLARSAERLGTIAADLKLRGASEVGMYALDLRDTQAHAPMLAAATAALGAFDGVLIAHGTLPDQAACAADPALALDAFAVNAASVIALCTPIANALEAQKGGCLAVISSVAGDRGRASNYVYGAAKAAVTALCSGLRQRLSASGVRVLTIKPGFVDTPMTASFRKGALWAKPEALGNAICRLMGQGNGNYYLPKFWWLIMAIIRSIPEPIFLKLRML